MNLRSSPSLPFLEGDGEVAPRIARFDWRGTPLGPIGGWPPSVRSVVSLILRSHVPIVTMWGADGVMIYNDAYARFAGTRHPGLLGVPVRDGWPEIAAFNDHVVRVGLAGETLAYADHEMTLQRGEGPETVWMNIDCSPILDEAGVPSGVMAIAVETSEKVRAERRVQGEQDRLRRMFEQAPGFMAMVHGPDHVVDLANDAFLRLVGTEAANGRPLRDVLPCEPNATLFETLDEVRVSGVARSGHAHAVEVRPGEGPSKRRHVDYVVQPLVDESGGVSGIFLQGGDVSDRVVAEGRLRASESRNRQVLDSAIDYAIIACDLEGRVTRWNEGARRILGWTEGEMLGGDLSRIFTPDDRAAGRPRVEMALALSKGWSPDERWHLRKSGERFWASGEMTPLRDESGAAVGVVKVLRDRTREYAARIALAQSEGQLRRAQEAGGVGVFTLDLDSNLVTGTPAFWRIFGLSSDRPLPAETVEALAVPEDAALVSGIEERRTGRAPLEVEYRIVRDDDGSQRSILRKAEFEFDDRGRAVRMAGVVQDVTERRGAQRAIEESERLFRTVSQTLPNQVWIANAAGRLEWFNDRVFEYSGTSPVRLGDAQWTAIVHPDDLASAQSRWADALASGDPYEAEFRLRRHDGAFRWHLSRASPFRAADGMVARWVGTNTDIHEQKLAQAANARDRDRMWTMSQDLMLISDFDGVIQAINPSVTRLLGWAEEDTVGRNVSEFVHPDDLVSTALEIEKLSQGNLTLAFENRYAAGDGSYRLLDWTAVPDGSRIHAVGRDITEARAIARDQDRIWTLSPVLKVVGTLSGAIVKINPAWTQTLGWAEHESTGRRLHDFVAPGADASAVARAEAGETLRDVEIEMASREGTRHRIAWSFVAEGGVLYGFGRDVTQQRATEDALRQSQKMEAVGQLTGGIAHDFNNLLQGITGSLALAQKRVEQGRYGELDRFLSNAMVAAHRCSSLTHRLLAFSRRQPLDPRPVRVNPLVTSMEELLRRSLGEQIRLRLVHAGGLWPTRCDPNQLENAILNLAINARDAMPAGGELVLETSNATLDRKAAARQRDVEPGEYVCIAVTDSGTGMSADVAARAFEPFFTTKPLGRGTGLGLSMIYGFAIQSGGFARIDSRPGRGTTVRVFLPRTVEEREAEADAPEPAPARVAVDGETVLVVEDEALVRELIVDALHELGYGTRVAVDGPGGVRLLQTGERVDLLVTDVGLPGLNGRQVADAGRALNPRLKVLFMTGYAENATASSGFLEPGMAIITKPFPMDEFAARVREIIEASFDAVH